MSLNLPPQILLFALTVNITGVFNKKWTNIPPLPDTKGMKSVPTYLSCGILGLALLAGVGCNSAPDPEVLEPYHAIHKERMAIREEIVEILNTIADEESSDDAIDPTLALKARHKLKIEERTALGPMPNEVKRYLWDNYSEYEKDLRKREDAAKRRAASVPGSANFFQEVPMYTFKMVRKRR